MIDGCGKVLTDEERHYYGATCNECERAWCDRIEDWRRGGTDAECDRLFGAPEQTHH